MKGSLKGQKSLKRRSLSSNETEAALILDWSTISGSWHVPGLYTLLSHFLEFSDGTAHPWCDSEWLRGKWQRRSRKQNLIHLWLIRHLFKPTASSRIRFLETFISRGVCFHALTMWAWNTGEYSLIKAENYTDVWYKEVYTKSCVWESKANKVL